MQVTDGIANLSKGNNERGKIKSLAIGCQFGTNIQGVASFAIFHENQVLWSFFGASGGFFAFSRRARVCDGSIASIIHFNNGRVRQSTE